jgi:hypothetical protein
LDIWEDCVAPIYIANYAVILGLIKKSHVFETSCNMKVFLSHALLIRFCVKFGAVWVIELLHISIITFIAYHNFLFAISIDYE